MNLVGMMDQAQAGVTKDYPVQNWNPDLSGDMDIQVKKDGVWIHEGAPIQRQALVQLFASVIKYESGEYFLVTPVEKWRIQVEDRPLQVLLVDTEQNPIQALLTNGQRISLDDEHPVKFSDLGGVEVPEVYFKHGLWARMGRNAYYTYADYILNSDP